MSAVKVQPKSHFLILYASQTGQAKAISEEIAAKALQLGLKPDLFCISLTDKRFSIEKETCIVFIVSTTDDGQPPDTAIKFIRRLNRNTLKSNYLEKLNYALLALGDSNYLRFAAFGRLLEHRLNALSARCFYSTGFGDDAFGIETGVDPWIDNLWPALHKQLGIKFVNNSVFDCYNLTNHINHKFVKMNTSELIAVSPKEIKSLSELPLILKTIDIEKCRVPKLPLPAFHLVFDKTSKYESSFTPKESTLVLPDSPLAKAFLISGRKLTFGDDVKDVLELTFKFVDEIIEYVPGDAFGFLCPNNDEEVDWLLKRLGLQDNSDVQASLALHENSSMKKKLPPHIPPSFSLREIFLHFVEIRAVPKKILLRVLAEYTENEEEKQCLLFLASQEGSSYFVDLIRKPSLSILDILMHYASCKPPAEKIIEYLPPLKPRFYSVASSPLVDKHTFRIVFSVLKIKSYDERQKDREGVCTGWLNRLASNMLATSSLTIADKLSDLTLDNDPKTATVYIYKRKNLSFRFPESLKDPLIMVGPGTGIAPFIGYLQHCEKLLHLSSEEMHASETWLFYGCRYKKKDFLYKTELDRFMQCKVLQNMVLSYSRDSQSSECTPRYVHENIKLHAQKIANCIQSGGKIFVCGDAKHMVHDVQQAFIKALQIGSGMNESDAKMTVESLQKEHRYVNDVWA